MNSLSEVLIIGLDPSLINKDVFWFEKNTHYIKETLNQNGFWQNNAFVLSANQKISPSMLLRAFDELGYEKVFETQKPGQFSAKGGLVEIFPINLSHPVKIEFFGNIVENILPASTLFTQEKREKFLKNKFLQETNLLNSLKEGEYLVHLDHGVGLYKGKKKFENNSKQEYLNLEYAAPRTGALPDRLFVPTRQVKKITRYLGFKIPILHRLGSSLWEQTKKKAKTDIIKLAKELLNIYAQREITKRQSYPIDHLWEKELASSFPFEETEDQLKAIEEIKKDLAGDKPMERLICGDVGFGKTEVALRAAVLAVAAGRQVALLTPTTILADQHFNTFQSRLTKFPIKVALLSRLESKPKQRQIIQNLKNSTVDIVIGTHRLLSSDIIFKNLGLLIIDEEQRFGVKQKEKLKKLKSHLDVLYLTATPIPRTLHMVIGGLKQVSLIKTPPPDRQVIKTFIEPFNKIKIKEALKQELQRNGQIYWLHNRVETLTVVEKMIKSLISGIKIGIIHGRLTEINLRKVMTEFRNHKIDLLLTTTIIENGLDVAGVNTIIIDDVSKLGLAQTHQIRGRIGRTHTQAYAYLFHPQNLTPEAQKRLAVLKDYQFLGAGFEIAKKDLEIRGAGNILGAEQSGTINQVGLNLYCQILSQTIEELSEGKIPAVNLW